MDLKLQNKVVVITGGSVGIGKALAKTYLAEGCNVVICGRNQGRLDAFMDECGYPGRALAVQADISKPEDQQKLFEATLSHFNRLDIWINNAGTVSRIPLLEAGLEEWNAIMDTNLKAVFSCIKLAASHMKDHGGGVIVNASSFASRIPLAGTGIYAVSKWGVNALTQVAAAELAPFGIRVFAFIPGIIVTEMTKNRIASNKKSVLEQIPLNRLGEPEDIAPIITMLTSDLAGYLTGVAVEISGGKFCVQNPLYGWEQQGRPDTVHPHGEGADWKQ